MLKIIKKNILFVIIVLFFNLFSLYADQNQFDCFLQKEKIQNDVIEFTYMYDDQRNNLVILKNGLWFQSIVVPNEIEAVLDSPECMMFFVKKIKYENIFIAEYYKKHILDCFYHQSFYYKLLRKLKRLNLYIFDKQEEQLFSERYVHCFLNLPKDVYKPCRHFNLKIQNVNKDQPDYIRVELRNKD